MTVYGTIAEYNPFHSGHKYLLDRMHMNSEDSVVVIMTGNFVQRAEPACMLPSSRCEAALRNGADLIIQLPLPWSLSGAQNFARGGVSLLKATNIVDTLCFGSENGNITALMNIAQALREEEVVARMKSYLDTGISFANARQRAVKDFYPGLSPILDNPNDNLGIEYLNALLDFDCNISPMCIKRYGAGHDSNDIGATASGKMLRKLIQSGEEVLSYMPKTAYEVFKRDYDMHRVSGGMAAFENIVLYKLRTTTAEEIAQAPDVSEGIENCIVSAARDARTIEELYSIAKSKRYSHARIRRIVMSTFLGVKDGDCDGLPPYIRVLGFNERGRELMRSLREKAELPIVTKYADVKKLDERAQRIYELEARAADIYALSFWPALPCGTEQRLRPVKLRSDSPVEMPGDEENKPAKAATDDEDDDAAFNEVERKPEKRERRFGRRAKNAE
ncbi:MAG: nucleotidyltransferase family protein [Clostridia bacterium]|nr:nucleotidyltransferase family protein [Clostridia bacterium]